jgi:Cytochrome bd terminal oxidase subunit I
MNSIFNDPGFWHRLQFGFTIVYHYLFPQLTMGLAWFIVYWKWRALRTGDDKYNQAVRFWAKIFDLILPSVSSPAFRWNSNSERIGQTFPNMPAA